MFPKSLIQSDVPSSSLKGRNADSIGLTILIISDLNYKPVF